MNFQRIFFTIFIITSFSTSCVAKNFTVLQTADSLFEQKDYVQALSAYQSIYQEGELSEAMLLKMAYIEEIEGDIPAALYYLSVAGQRFPNQKFLTKMEGLAQSSGIKGYRVTDIQRIEVFLYRFRWIIYALLIVLTLVTLYSSIQNFKKVESKSYLTRPVFPILLLLIVANINLKNSSKGIIKGSPLLVMNAPAASGKRVNFDLTGGEKVTLGKVGPLWVEIQLEEKRGYIRNNQLMILPKT